MRPSSFSIFLLALGLASVGASQAQPSSCVPEWTVTIFVEHGSGESELSLVMDTASTAGLDVGLDLLCPPNLPAAYACLLSEGARFEINHIPSNGDSAIHFFVEIDTDGEEMEMTLDLGMFALDSASLSWNGSNGWTSADVLSTPYLTIPAGLGATVLEGVLVPDCTIEGCMDPLAENFNPLAQEDDGSCMTSDLFAEVLGTFETGEYDVSAAEIVDHHSGSQRLFFIRASTAQIGVLDIADPATPTLIEYLDAAAYGSGATSVVVMGDHVAATILGPTIQDEGKVVIFDVDGNFVAEYPAGFWPDAIALSPDGSHLLVSNEGQPAADFSLGELIDKPGSATLIDVSSGPDQGIVTQVSFAGLTSEDLPEGVRISTPGASIEQDLEPEFGAFSMDGSTAYIACQENNAIIVIDIEEAEVTGVWPLGARDYALDGGLDPSDLDGSIAIAPWPVKGLRMPDAIHSWDHEGQTILLTANEGDSREYGSIWTDETRVANATLDSVLLNTYPGLQDPESLGRMLMITTEGDTDGDGDHDEIVGFGSRSFTIYDTTGTVLYDSGSEFEERTAALLGEAGFNFDNDEVLSFDERSDDKGPEPEGIEIGELNGRTYAFVGLERVSAVMVFDMTDLDSVHYVRTLINRDFEATSLATSGDLGPEGLRFISEEDSPDSTALLVTSNEVSGTVTLWRLTSLLPPAVTPGCTDEDACNFNPEATEDDGSCEYPFFCFDCEGNCLCDEDMDGVCDPFEFPGCTDPEACNWAPVYTEEDGSCYYAQDGFDCNGFCLPVANDECSMAEPIACSQIVTATTVCADTTESQYCDQYNIGQYFHGGLWYSITGTGDTLRATMCFEDTGYDTYLSVYEGDCDNLDCVAGNDDQDEVNFFAEPCFENFLASEVEWDSDEGVEYFLHVSGSNAVTPAVGGFDFVLVCDGVEVGGCLDSLACNYNPFVTFDDESCDYATCAGCGLSSACNFDSTAFINDLALCDFTCYGCTDSGACNFSPDATIESGLCEYSSCAGCLDPEACNFDVTALLDADNCEYTSCVGCTDETASNFNPQATVEDGSCTYCDLVLSAVAISSESCFGAMDGTAQFTVDSALTDSVYYTLVGPAESLSGTWIGLPFDSLAPGSYLLEVLDGDSTCSAVQPFSILAAPDIALFVVASAPFCAGGEDGSISAFVADTVAVSEYLLDGEPASMDGNFLGLGAGEYLVEVTAILPSGSLCADTASIDIVDPPGMTISFDSIEGANPGEENGEVSVTVTGGEEPYDFFWTGPTGNTGLEDPDDLGAGEWILTVTDNDGCQVTDTVSVPVGILEWLRPEFSMAPNPTRDRLDIRFESPFQGTLILVDALGREVEAHAMRGTHTTWSLAGHPAGVYLVRAMGEDGRRSAARLVIED